MRCCVCIALLCVDRRVVVCSALLLGLSCSALLCVAKCIKRVTQKKKQKKEKYETLTRENLLVLFLVQLR